MEPSELHIRFEHLNQVLEGLEYQIRVFAPVAGQVVRLEASREEVMRELSRLRSDLKDAEESAVKALDAAYKIRNDIILAGRTENLKLIGIVVAAFTALTGTVAAVLKFGGAISP